MVRICYICKKEYIAGRGRSCHGVPKLRNLRQKWCSVLAKCGVFHISTDTNVCSDHFPSEDCYLSPAGRRLLRKGAVPSIIPLSREVRIKMEHTEVDWHESKVDNKELLKIKIENQLTSNTNSEELLFIKNEKDQHTEATEVLNSVKSEPDEVGWDQYDIDYKNTLEMEAENNKLDMEMCTQVKEEPIFKDDYDIKTGIVPSRIKNEYASIDNPNECTASENDELNVQLSEIKPETCMDSEDFKAAEITEEFTIKSESETSMDAILDVPSNSMAKSKILTKRQVVCKKADGKLFTCIHCETRFKKKTTLDDHVIKYHPDFIASVNRKIYECSKCVYKTVQKNYFDKHMSSHPETSSGYKVNKCAHCNETFKSKASLDDHLVRKHPNSVTSVTRQIYECTECSYITTFRWNFNSHISVHSETNSTGNLIVCSHCNAKFKKKTSLDDHIIKKHRIYFTPGTRKIYECTKCTYKTAKKDHIDRHDVSAHPGTNFKLISCTHCDATFKSATGLADHVVKRHPNFVSSVTRKTHKCMQCSFKTVIKRQFDRHMSTHHGTVSSYKPDVCIHCNATFKSKRDVDEHVVREHPNFITSVTSKLHECTKCTYRTVMKGHFNRHVLIHNGTDSSKS